MLCIIVVYVQLIKFVFVFLLGFVMLCHQTLVETGQCAYYIRNVQNFLFPSEIIIKTRCTYWVFSLHKIYNTRGMVKSNSDCSLKNKYKKRYEKPCL